MFQPQCRCRTTRDCVVIPQNREDHIIRRHFFPPINESFDPRRSLFLVDVITPEALFMIIFHKLRNGLQPVERGRHGRYVYYVPFPYDVGVFPFDPRGPYTSNIVKNHLRLCALPILLQALSERSNHYFSSIDAKDGYKSSLTYRCPKSSKGKQVDLNC